MRLHRALILLGIMILINGFFYAQPPLKIPYQAVIRTPEGEILANQPAVVRTSIILGQPTDDAVFAETHSVTSNPFGVVSLVLGNGTTIAGNFDEINWKAGVAFLKIEIDYQNTGSYTLIGVSQILSVPYALKSGNSLDQLSGQQGQIISHDGADWQAYDKVWVNPGVVTVDGAPTKNPEDPIFQIKNQAGEVLFTVNSQGVEVKLTDSGEEQGSLRVQGLSATEPFLVISPDSALVQFNTDGTRAEKGGFAVGGLSSGKPVSTPYFMLEPAMTTLNFDKAAATKAEKGGFAVGGLSSGKLVTGIFTIEQDCTRMYIASELERAEKGGFAVGGLSSGKPLGQEYFRLSSLGAQVTFDEDLQRAEKGGFAVGGLSNGKTLARDYLNLSQEQVKFSMAERDEKSGLGGFTIGGYMDNGEQYTSFFNLNPISVIINTGSVTTGEIVIGGDVNVGGEIIFQPEVSTDYYAEVTETTALAFGTLYADGGGAISAFGFVWDTLAETTVERYLGQCVMPEVQFLPFWCQLTGLDSATTYYVRAFATNSAGTAYGSEFEFTTLTGWEDKPTATAPSVSDMTDYSALFLTTVENPFAITMISKGFVVNLTGNPTRSVNNGMFETEALEAGELSGEISELMADTLYYARAFVKFYADVENGIEATFYSEQTTFRTQPSPWVVSGEVLTFNDISASLAATLYIPDNVTQDAYGFVWNTFGNPDFDSGNYTGSIDFYDSPETPHAFVGTMSGLEPSTTYYVKPYVYNYHGYSYGNELPVTTKPSPTVSTEEVLAISDVAIEAYGTITTGDCEVFGNGFVWSTTPNVNFDNNYQSSSWTEYTVDAYRDTITELIPATTYYVRAYIWHNRGYSYGEEKQVTTFNAPSINTNQLTLISDRHATVEVIVTIPTGTVAQYYGVVYDTDPGFENSGYSALIETGGSGTFEVPIEGLLPSTLYYVRGFITHTSGESFGNTIDFTTQPSPSVTTDSVGDITIGSAVARGTIAIPENTSALKVGFVWGLTETVSFEDSHINFTENSEFVVGEFSDTLLELESETQYYVRAYIQQNDGNNSYGSVKPFTTIGIRPIFDFTGDVTENSATALAHLQNLDNCIAGYGFVWSISENPELGINEYGRTYQASDNNTIFSAGISGLEPNTTYWVRAYLKYACEGSTDTILHYSNNSTQFTTAAPNLGVQTIAITQFGPFGFNAVGMLTNDDLYTVDTVGFVYANFQNPDTTNNDSLFYFTDWRETGMPFEHYFGGLTPGNSIYLRTFAVHNGSVQLGIQQLVTLPVENGVLYDTLNNDYTTRYIGLQNWMTQNLRVTVFKNSSSLPAGSYSSYQNTNNTDSIAKYGYLYRWDVVKNHLQMGKEGQTICPRGWRLPNQQLKSEWSTLMDSFGGYNASPNLKATGIGWNIGNGAADPTNTSGFGAVPGGYWSPDSSKFAYMHSNAFYWSEPANEGEDNWFSQILSLSSFNDNTELPNVYSSQNMGYSIRCIQNFEKLPQLEYPWAIEKTHNSLLLNYMIWDDGNSINGTTGLVWSTQPRPTLENNEGKKTVPIKRDEIKLMIDGLQTNTTYYIRSYATNSLGTVYSSIQEFTTDSTPSVLDNENNKYPIVTIGSMEWMGSNLKTSHYNNIELINDEWQGYPYKFDPYMLPNAENYGFMYQHGVVTDPRGICPNGWGIPRREDWQELIDSLGGLNNAGKALKSDSVSTEWGYWSPSATPGSNLSGFNAMPAGYYHMFSPNDQTVAAYFWSRYQTNDTLAVNYKLSYDSDVALTDTSKTEMAFSVRCIKDRPAKKYPVNVVMNEVLPQSPTSLKISAKIVDSGNTLLSARGFYYGIEPDPTAYIDIPLMGNFENIIEGLTPATVYNFKATATNDLGEVFSNIVSFETQGYTLPSLGPSSLTDTTATSVQCWSSVVGDGYTTITARGFVWGTASGVVNDTIIVGGEMGEMSYTITSLEPATTYYIRAFATNSEGTVYGEEMVCTTFAFEGSGTDIDPYQISNLNSLVYLSEHSSYWGGHFIQTANIDARTTKGMNSGMGFSPIGTETQGFTGTYNGKGNYIDSLYIDRSAMNYNGMFGHAVSATLKKINLTNATVKGSLFTGGIVGNDNSSTVDSCSVTGEIFGNNTHTGGIVGIGSTTTIQNSHFSGNVNGQTNVGGIIGAATGGTIQQSSANGIINGTGSVGGVIGYATTDIYILRNFSYGSVTSVSGSSVGGLLGQLNTASFTFGNIENCYSNSIVTGQQYVGGLVGQASGGGQIAIKYCYSTGEVTGDTDFYGLVGICSGTIENSTWDIESSGLSSFHAGVTGKTNEQMQAQSTFTNWDFESEWAINEGETYPYLRWQGTPGDHNYPTIVKDIDGNVYRTTKIDNQVWLTSNLKTTKLNTGVEIYNETGSSWMNLAVPGYCAYENNNTNFDTFGALYNWKAVETGMLCPVGWRVSADEDWNDLITYLGTQGHSGNEGVVLKKVGAWDTDAGNPYNFSSLPGGGRDEYATFNALNTHAIFWTKNAVEPDSAKGIVSMNSTAILESFTSHKNNGFSVRCIKNISKFSGGQGTPEEPYHINTLANLHELAQSPGTWDKHFIQNNDIDASSTVNFNQMYGWTPIGNSSKPFQGVYNGNGKTITRLSIANSGLDNAGLFGVLSAATINDLGVVQADINGNQNVGALAGAATLSSTIQNCHSTGVIGGQTIVGGLVGLNSASVIEESYSSSNVSASVSIAGGLVGKIENSATVINSYSAGGEVFANSYCGGITAINDGSYIANCFNTSIVNGETEKGGLVGSGINGGTIDNSYFDKELSQINEGDPSQSRVNIAMGIQSTYSGWDFENIWSIDEEVSTPYLKWQITPGLHNYSILLSDVDGNKYKTVKIGTQVWMAENLKTTKYNLGEAIPEGTFPGTWETLTTGAYLNYQNHPDSGSFYGRLYNWHAISNNICPVGWHVPTRTEWTTLISNAGESQAGLHLKSNSDWISTGNGDNSYGFNAKPYGYNEIAAWLTTGSESLWASSTFADADNFYVFRMTFQITGVEELQKDNNYGIYIRCLKNATKFSNGDGTEGNPYQINNLNDLNELANSPGTWDKYFEQTDTIRANATMNYYSGLGWKPIGNDEVPFRGVYDGKGYKIDSLHINNLQSGIYSLALFGATNGATIKNLGINKANINAMMGWDVAGLIGYAQNTTVEKCYVTGNVQGSGDVGALIGYAENSTILQSFGNANISGMEAISGLIGGTYKTLIKDCYVRGNLSGSGNLNGLAFCDSGMVVNSYSAVMISGGEANGGLVSAQEETMLPKVKFSFYDSEMAIDALSNGAFPKPTAEMQSAETFIRAGWDFKGWGANGVWNIGNGQNEGYPYLSWQSPADPDILPADMLPGVYTYKPTEITTTSATFNGEMPFLGAEATVATQYGFCWNTTGNPTTSDSKVELGAPLDTLTFSFTIATLTINRHYYVRAFATNGESTAYGDVVEFFTLPIEPVAPALGDGSPENPYQIANLANLFWLSQNLPATCWDNINSVQTADIPAAETEFWYGGAGWPTIGISEHRHYNGYYKGQGHKISNLHINRPVSEIPVGLFSYTNSTAIDSLGLENINIIGNNNVGAFIGKAGNSSKVEQCYVTGIVNGQNVVGGLIGHNNGSFISNSYSVAEVNGIDSVGGLVGFNNSSNFTIGYCAGKVTGSDFVGGITGASFNDMSSNNNCFWDSLATSQLTSAEGSGYGTPEMVIPGTYWSFNFESGNIWGIVGSESYPYLLWQGGPAEFNYASIVQDIDGNTYKTVKIGTQVWMAENLKTTKYNDGANIHLETNAQNWIENSTPAYCSYWDDPSNLQEYGALYNGFVVESGNLCPVGWHIPSSADWNILFDFYGGMLTAGHSLRETGTNHWQNPNSGALNTHGFSALPAGMRDPGFGGFSDINTKAHFWSNTATFGSSLVSYNIVNSNPEIYQNDMGINGGISVRCLKNTQKFSGGTGTSEEPYIINTLADLNELAQSPGTWDKHFKQNANISAAATVSWYENSGWKPIGTTTNHFTGTYDGNGHSIDSLYINRTGELNVGLFGFAMNATLKNLTIKAQNIAANGNAGTLVGNMNSGVIDNCHANTIVASAGDNGGVLIGVAYSTTISGCSSMGSVSSDGWCGGLIGSCSDSHVLQSFSASNVNGNAADAGGFIGKIDGISEISNCYATGSVSTTTGKVGGFIGTNNGATITNCFSTGMVTGESLVGGFVGEVTGGTLATSYWDTESCGQEASAGGEGKTNLEMSQQASFEGWDFATIWSIDEEVSTPYLQWQTAPGMQNFTRFVTDMEGNRYKIARIGTQVWMRENLRANKFNNAIDIPLVEDNSAWGAASTPAYCYSQNNIIYKANKGTLYNGFTVSSGNICPVGWRVPSVTDWETLKTHVGTNFPGSEGDALKLESMWWTDLGDPYSFSAIHSGYRAIDGQFWNDADDAFYWTNTEETSGVLYFYSLTNTDALLTQGQYSSVRGNSVRCIRNETKFFGGDGTVGTPYLISSLADLNELAQSPETWDKYFEQTQDIVATETNTWHAGAGWMPIGHTTKPFSGHYSGEGFSISNLYMYRDGTQYTGFFGVCDNATISNMVLSEVDFTAGSTLGGLSGSIGNTTIQNCATTGSINGNGFMGGIVGYCSNSQILNSYSASNIAASGTDVGGLAGKTENTSLVENCYSTGEVIAGDYVGGLIGRNENSTISNCYSLGMVTQATTHGGLVSTNTGTITNSYWNRTTSGANVSAGGTGLVNIKFGKKKTFEGWDFTTIWAIDEFDTYPHFQWQSGPEEHNMPVISPFNFVEDADLNKYGIIYIGSQAWMDENLRTTKYTDGTAIPEETDNATWNAFDNGARRCWYNNDSTNNAGTYGSLYSFFTIDPATNGGKQLCPTGWHPATDSDWSSLITFLGTEGHTGNEGTVLKAQTGWSSGNGTDNYGFEGFPGGKRDSSMGDFVSFLSEGYWWRSEFGADDANDIAMGTGTELFPYVNSKREGKSVRCVQNY